MNKKNLCPFCRYAVPQKNSGLGLVTLFYINRLAVSN